MRMLLIWLSLFVAIYYIINWLVHRPKIGHYGERYVLITGCDTGFGNLLAKRLDKLGFHVFAGCLTQKGEKELTQQSSRNLKTVSLDVTKLESIEAACEIVKAVLPDGSGLWGLVNNAGIGYPVGPVEWLSKEHYMTVMNVNVFGIVDITRTFLPLLKKAKGRIVNMSSISGFLSSPGAIPYSISKFGVESYSDAIRRELKPQGIKVSMLEPSLFQTDIIGDNLERSFREVHASLPDNIRKDFGSDYLDKAMDFVKYFNSKTASTKFHLVIDAYEHALTARVPKSRYLVGYMAKCVIWPLHYLLPTWVTDAVLPNFTNVGR